MDGLAFVHRAPALGTAASETRRLAQRRGIGIVDGVDYDRAGIQAIRIDRHRVSGLHSEWRRVDDDVASVRVGWTETRAAGGGFGGDSGGKVDSATLVDIEYRQRTGASRRDRKCDGTSRASRSHQKDGVSGGIIPFPLHAKYATQTIKRCSHPPTVAAASDDVECADLTGSQVEFIDKAQHPLLVGHRDEEAVEISDRAGARDKSGEVVRLNRERNANRLDALFGE